MCSCGYRLVQQRARAHCSKLSGVAPRRRPRAGRILAMTQAPAAGDAGARAEDVDIAALATMKAAACAEAPRVLLRGLAVAMS